MRAGEADRLARAHGCKLKPVGRGNWRVTNKSGAFVLLTTAELKRTNDAKFLTQFIPQEAKS